MGEHTPGPWEHDNRHYWIDGKRYGMDSWAIMRGSYCLATTDKNEANARLIAAAPDLLKALEETQDMLIDLLGIMAEGLSDHPLDGSDWYQRVMIVDGINRQVIAKAEGE